MDEWGKAWMMIIGSYFIGFCLIVFGGYKAYKYFTTEKTPSETNQIILICSDNNTDYYVTNYKDSIDKIIDLKTSIVFDKKKCRLN